MTAGVPAHLENLKIMRSSIIQNCMETLTHQKYQSLEIFQFEKNEYRAFREFIIL